VKTETDTDTEVDDVDDTDDVVAADDDVVEPIDPPSDEQDDIPSSRLPQLLLTGAIALVVATAAVAGWFGVAWLRAANDDSLAYSQMRDDVVRVGQNAIVTMNTLDYRKVDQGLKDWETVTTGELKNQVVQGRKTSKDAIVAAQSVTKATVLSAGVVELDDRAGQASVLVALRVHVEVKGEKPTDKYRRLAGKLQRTDDGWKLYEIGEVPYSQPGQ
jgi:Mce-associated membrane protein